MSRGMKALSQNVIEAAETLTDLNDAPSRRRVLEFVTNQIGNVPTTKSVD
jgi:hypothetical protein